ncbi:hypothetical protein H5410_056434 [Solanum commersonii]|uniref:Uncharacterized protein n=1 Tax=Solanum commersonii TaxID=4109 RepID=A0A9J5WM86_SOLCO|nr:hypothetical protein H5410_056434 [Solanum commersonii]
MTSKIWITKRSRAYNTRKLAKRDVYPLQGLFDLENGPKFGLPKDPWTISHDIQQNGWFTIFGDHITLKMGRGFTQSGDNFTLTMGHYTNETNRLHIYGLDGLPRNFLT